MDETKMYYWNRLFVQKIMSRGFLKGPEVYKIVKDILGEESLKKYSQFPRIKFKTEEEKESMGEMIPYFLDSANHNLKRICLEIKKGFDESLNGHGLYETYYALCPINETESIAKLQRMYTENELDWLRLTCEYLITEVPDHHETENKLINLGLRGFDGSNKRKLIPKENLASLKKFEAEGYLVRDNRRGSKLSTIRMGVRLLMELDYWLQQNTTIPKCGVCGNIVAMSIPCRKCADKRDPVFFHKRCLGRKSYKCSVCKEVIKCEGIASKR